MTELGTQVADLIRSIPPHCMAPSDAVKASQFRRTTNEVKTPNSSMKGKPPSKRIKRGENAAYKKVRTQPIDLQSPRDTLSVKGRASTQAHDEHVPAYDRWGEFNEVAGGLEYEDEFLRGEAEHCARILCGFDDDDMDGRQGAGTALPTVAKRNLDEGTPDDQDHLYHG
ncbi:hypothetical protein KBI52_29665 [Microvirga sp. HBU67558]|uniref:hypothetical protein n=1 Tax=Microvirga TaxID=186650 RepID=UPI001B35ED27|nr:MULTISPECIES: hypothetical protein [unclassified Microvirga]MBQ0824368.1 hypothetical protein [Microvirga sp. HBU67558]